MRAGTENVSGIAGLGKALELSLKNMDAYTQHMQDIKQYTVDRVCEAIPGVKFNGRSSEKDNSLYTVVSSFITL